MELQQFTLVRNKKSYFVRLQEYNKFVPRTFIHNYKNYNLLKKVLLYILFFTSISEIYAQKAHVKNMAEYDDKPLHFGYTMGINVMDFTFGRYYMRNAGADTIYADQPEMTLGFQVGMVSDFRLGEYFNLRILPSFNFGQRNLYFYNGHTPNSISKLNRPLKIESSMLDLPILIKYKAKRINNFRPYYLAGTSIRYDLAAKSKYDEAKGEYILLKPLDIYGEMGFGMDFYLQYFKFSTEIKFSLGIFNILNTKKPDTYQEYVESLYKLKSNILMLSLHFE
jgi:hypothetical protein